MSDDILDTLRRNPLYIPTSRINSFGRPQMGFELTSFNLIAADEIERLRKERDEARREVCELSARCVRANYFLQIKNPTHLLPKDVAKSRGWDCFNEVKP